MLVPVRLLDSDLRPPFHLLSLYSISIDVERIITTKFGNVTSGTRATYLASEDAVDSDVSPINTHVLAHEEAIALPPAICTRRRCGRCGASFIIAPAILDARQPSILLLNQRFKTSDRISIPLHIKRRTGTNDHSQDKKSAHRQEKCRFNNGKTV